MNVDIAAITRKLSEEIEKIIIEADTQILVATGKLQGVKLLYEEIKRETERIQSGRVTEEAQAVRPNRLPGSGEANPGTRSRRT